MNYNQPPPPQQQYQGAAPPPPTNNNVLSTGKTPIARRTRSSKVNNNTQKATVGPPPPQYQMAPHPPPANNNNNTNTTQLPSTMYNPSLSGYESLNVNDAIAKRRAELRHLQQRQRDNGTLTNVARNKLSQGGNVSGVGVGGDNITLLPGVNSRLQQQPPTNNNNKPPPSTQNITNNKPASNLTMPLPPQPQTNNNNNNQATTMQSVVPTPPVARRLDNSYGVEQQQRHHRAPPQCQYPNQINPNNNNINNFANNDNINDNVPPMRSESYQEQRRSSSSTSASSNRPGNQKRNSEIFNAGKMKLHQQHVGSSSSRENSSTMRSGLSTKANNDYVNTTQQQQQTAAPKSPFGQARTILSVKQGDLNPMLGVPPFQPPLTTFNTTDNDGMGVDDEIEVVEENEDLLQNNIMPPGKKISPTASNSSVALKLGDRLVGEVDSGSSTPIMSNSFDEADNHHDNPTSSTQSVAAAVSSSTTLNTNNNNNNMSRLMSDLQRTEREKAEALEQVNKLRLLLATNHTTTANNNEQQPTSMATNTTSSGNNITMPSTSSSSELLNQFREMVTRQGASAAVDWMSKQLENNTPDSSTNLGGLLRTSSPETPSRRPPLNTRGASLNYAGGSELPLSSNSIPPLTPRSRSGSRAASPERGHGINVSSGSTARSKRITTPLPKKLKVSNDSLDDMVTTNNGDISSSQRGQQKGQNDNNNSPGIEQEYLTKASKCIPNEYGTMLASYIVRRPYISSNTTTTSSTNNSTNIEEEEFLQYKQLSTKQNYISQATVLNPNTLEVIAYIEADNSILTLSGVSNVCHGYNNNTNGGNNSSNGGDWTTFNNVEENDVALGKVTYIDVDGNECDYWLDSIYEEALTTRESYCMSMISAAFALKEVTGGQQQGIGGAAMMSQQKNVPVHQEYQQQPMLMHPPASPARQQQQQYQEPPQTMTQQQPMYQPMQQQPRYAQPMGDMPSNQMQDAPPLMNEGNVASQPTMAAQQPPMPPGSEKQPPSSEPTQQVKSNQQEQTATTSTKKKLQPEEEYESADSALPYMIMSLFTLFLSIVTFVIKIPFRIGSTIFTFWVMIVVLRVLWLLLADDGGAYEFGAGVNYEYNMPGIY